jgi:DNA invertase Pin-like site-specific DNA recombinase
MRTIGYLRVSTAKQETEKNKAAILTMANDLSLGKVEFVEEVVSGTIDWKKRKLGDVLEELELGDNIVVPELSRLGRSTLGILEILKMAKSKSINVFSVKGRWQMDDSIQSKILSSVLAMIAEIERDLISQRTKESLAARKAAGVILGRPRGLGKSKLDKYEPEIKALLANGSTKTFVANRYGCSVSTLSHWIDRRGTVALTR